MKAGVGASVPLPGTVNVSRCSRVTADIGKCSICGITKAAWIDREAGVKRSDHCYGRGVREDAREGGIADAIIYATALRNRAKVVTGDPHFRTLPEVIFVGKG